MRSTISYPSYCVLLALIGTVLLCGSADAQHERDLDFFGKNGSGPSGGVVVDALGNFYGATAGGGSANLGTVYEISPTNGSATEMVLYSFLGGSNGGDGANPIGDLMFDQGGNLYGVTEYGGNLNPTCPTSMGCGTVFELSPPSQEGGSWTETVLYRFQGNLSDGAQPKAGLVADGAGNLYGTTSFGGTDSCESGCGSVFELSPPSEPGGSWTETVLYLFQAPPDGGQPVGGVILDAGGNLYGTTSLGGQAFGGSIFELTPPSSPNGSWTETIVHSLLAGTDGYSPVARLAITPGGALFGTASLGGPTGFGTVFRLLPPPSSGGIWGFGVVHAFNNSTDGSRPLAGLTFGNPYTLYGTAASGGVFNCGTVFEISAPGGNITFSVHSSGNGCGVASDLTLYNHALYGTTSHGGYSDDGIAFELRP